MSVGRGLYANYPPTLSNGYPTGERGSAPTIPLFDYGAHLVDTREASQDKAIYWRFIPPRSGLVRFDITMSYILSTPDYYIPFTFSIYGDHEGVWDFGPGGFQRDSSYQVIKNEPITIAVRVPDNDVSLVVLRVSGYAGETIVKPAGRFDLSYCETNHQITTELVGEGGRGVISRGAYFMNSYLEEPSEGILDTERELLWRTDGQKPDPYETSVKTWYHGKAALKNNVGLIEQIAFPYPDPTADDFTAPYSMTRKPPLPGNTVGPVEDLPIGPPPLALPTTFDRTKTGFPASIGEGTASNFEVHAFTYLYEPEAIRPYPVNPTYMIWNAPEWTDGPGGAYPWNLIASHFSPTSRTFYGQWISTLDFNHTPDDDWDAQLGNYTVNKVFWTYDHMTPEEIIRIPVTVNTSHYGDYLSIPVQPGVLNTTYEVTQSQVTTPTIEQLESGISGPDFNTGEVPVWHEIPSSIVEQLRESEEETFEFLRLWIKLKPSTFENLSGGKDWNFAMKFDYNAPAFVKFKTYLPELPEVDLSSITGAFDLTRARFT